MELDALLATLKETGIEIRLNEDGKIAIPRSALTPTLRAAIIRHKTALSRYLQSEQTGKRKVPGAIRLDYAINWLAQSTRRIDTSREILMADRGRQKARITLPSRCRWLIGWLPKAQRVEFEAKGDLPWTDWNDVMGDVRGKFESDCGQ